MPTTTLHVSNLEAASQMYERVFELEPLVGDARFYDAGWRWAELETALEEGAILTVRLVEANGETDAFPADDFGRLVVRDLQAALQKASQEGFTIVSAIETVNDGRLIFRALDPDKNRIVVGNASLWVRKKEASQ
jgi:predicted enzyme related to lactoylglutathione lyase